MTRLEGDWWCGHHKSWNCRYDPGVCEPLDGGPGYRSASADYPLLAGHASGRPPHPVIDECKAVLDEIEALRERARRGQYIVDCFHARKGASNEHLLGALDAWDALS